MYESSKGKISRRSATLSFPLSVVQVIDDECGKITKGRTPSVFLSIFTSWLFSQLRVAFLMHADLKIFYIRGAGNIVHGQDSSELEGKKNWVFHSCSL